MTVPIVLLIGSIAVAALTTRQILRLMRMVVPKEKRTFAAWAGTAALLVALWSFSVALTVMTWRAPGVFQLRELALFFVQFWTSAFAVERLTPSRP